MNNKDYLLKFLDLNLYLLYLKNLKKENKLEFLYEKFSTSIISSSFVWKNTEEGHDFWAGINASLELQDETEVTKNMLKIICI